MVIFVSFCFVLMKFSVSESVEEDVLEMFFKDREVNGDFISKASDMLWQRGLPKDADIDVSEPDDTSLQEEQVCI